MRPVFVLAMLLIFGAPGASWGGQAQAPPASTAPHHANAATPRPATEVPAALVGRWRSTPFELELVSDLHRSVYGPNAKSVRVTEVVLRPSGEGTFTVSNLVRNRRGLPVTGTRSVEELTFALGAAEPAPGDRTRYQLTVQRAERRYLDEPTGTFPLDGAKLELYLPSDKKDPLEVRYDTPEGVGSFWETLRPAVATRTPPRPAPAPARQ